MASRRRNSRRAALALAAFALALTQPACSVLVDLDGLAGAPPDGGGAGGGGVVCKHDTWPAPAKSAPDGGSDDFYSAVRMIEMGETKPEPEGFDLDGTCTCSPDPPSCVYPKYAPGEHCDNINGRDNATAKVFQQLQVFAGVGSVGSSNFSAKAEIGTWSLLVRVSGYNGQADDATVRVALYETYWDDTTQPKQPSWGGTDLWTVAASSLADGASIDSPKYVDNAAYVVGNVVVASLPEAFIGLGGGSNTLGIRLVGGTLIGTIEKLNGRYRVVDGLIAGRWPSDDVFKVLGTFEVSGQTLCNDGSFAYTRFKELICQATDIASTLGGPTLPCDSLSFGMKFATEPAAVEKIGSLPAQMSPCTKATNPANDTCDSL